MTIGIYCFKHKIYPFIYIGSSRDIENRYSQYIKAFRKGNHTLKNLAIDFLKGSIVYSVLKSDVKEKELLYFEQLYIDSYLDKGYYLYNRSMPLKDNNNDAMFHSPSSLMDSNNASILHLKNIVAQQNIVIKSLNERCELLECRNEEYEIMVKSVRDTKNPNIFKQIEWWGEVLI